MNRARQSGLTVVELMVAMVIGLFLVAGVLTLFAGNNRTYHYNQTQILEAENMRISSRMLNALLPQAGHTAITTAAIKGKRYAFPSDSDPASYQDFTSDNVVFAAGQVISGNSATRTVTINVNGSSTTEVYPDDDIAIRYFPGDGIMSCEGLRFLPDIQYADANATEIDYLVQQRVEALYVDDESNLACESTTLTITAADPDVHDRTARANTILLGDVNAEPGDRVAVLGMGIRYGVDTDDDGSADRYVRDMEGYLSTDASAWLKVNSAIVELTIQTGTRPPETVRHAIAFSNMIDASQGD